MRVGEAGGGRGEGGGWGRVNKLGKRRGADGGRTKVQAGDSCLRWEPGGDQGRQGRGEEPAGAAGHGSGLSSGPGGLAPGKAGIQSRRRLG